MVHDLHERVGKIRPVVSYFAVFLCGFAALRESRGTKSYFTQRREDAKTRKAKPRHYRSTC